METVNDSKREMQLKLVTILRYVMMGLMFLVLVSWILPYFTYPAADYVKGDKGAVDTKSLWGVLLTPDNFPQIEKVMDIKYISLRQLHVVVVLAVCGIIGIIVCGNKRGLGTCLFPLIFSVYGVIGYLTVPFMSTYCTHTGSRLIQLVLVILTLVATIASIVMNIAEMKSRPADYYLTAPGT